tara:strand:- start:607 stop:1188 length:582 start_codon:yes stop_codon:yes gene_type:complete
MPTVNLNPDGTLSNNWTTLSGSTAHGALADSNTGSYIRTPDQNDSCVLTLDDYSAGGTINSIRFGVSGYTFLTRGGDTDIRVRIMNSSGTSLYDENVTLNFNGYVAQDHYGTARTTSDGSSAWTDSDLDGLRLAVDTTPEDPPAVSQATVVKAWVEVTYTAAGYGNNVNGVAAANISKVNGIATASISKVIGV